MRQGVRLHLAKAGRLACTGKAAGLTAYLLEKDAEDAPGGQLVRMAGHVVQVLATCKCRHTRVECSRPL